MPGQTEPKLEVRLNGSLRVRSSLPASPTEFSLASTESWTQENSSDAAQDAAAAPDSRRGAALGLASLPLVGEYPNG